MESSVQPATPAISCLRPSVDPPPEDAHDPGDEHDAERTRRRQLIRCRACATPIAAPEDRFAFRALSHTQVHANLHGIIHEIVTLRAAQNLALDEDAETAFSWFRGYAWRIASCRGCWQHLGWQFEGADGATPARFYALRVEQLVTEPG